MAYRQLTVEVTSYPHVDRFIRRSLEMFFRDVHAMLRLPMHGRGIAAGCNYSIAHALLASVAGISTSLYRPGKLEPYGGAFTGVLVDWYPWELEKNPPPTRGEKQRLANLLYEEFRGPLFHYLGLSVGRSSTGSAILDRGYAVKIKRRTRRTGEGFSEKELQLLETSNVWPFPTFFQETISERADAIVLNVERFYWGIRQMVIGLTGDQTTMNSAEAFLSRPQIRRA